MHRGKDIKVRSLQISFLAIATVVVFEAIVGLSTSSLAILGDAAHALFDTVSTLILLLTTKWSLRPPDEEHLYGHGKIEPIGGLIGGITLVGLSALLFYEAATRILFGGQIVRHELVGFAAVGYTLAIDFFRIGTLWGKGEGSATLRASFYHALSDFGSTVIALLGFGLTYIGGDDRIDAAASIVLSFLLVYLTIGLIRSSGAELSDQIPRSTVSEVRKEIVNTQGVSACKDLKIRKVGAKIFVETTICVPASMDLDEAHDVASRIESKIASTYGDSTVTVHIEPLGRGTTLKKQVESLAANVKGVKGVHSLSSVYSNGKLYITLHALVDPHLPIDEAHNIAETIEQSLTRHLSSAENVTVHIEPYEPRIHRESRIDDTDISRMIKQIVAEYPSIQSVKRTMTFASEQRRYINIDVAFDKRVSVEAMHDTVTKVEEEIKRHFKRAVVTIHAEPSQ